MGKLKLELRKLKLELRKLKLGLQPASERLQAKRFITGSRCGPAKKLPMACRAPMVPLPHEFFPDPDTSRRLA